MRYKNTDAVPIKEEGATKMPNELKPEDVMKALECHSNNFDCHSCPMPICSCEDVLIKNALALLREKDATLEMCAETIERQDEELAEKDAEIERLTSNMNGYAFTAQTLSKEFEDYRADVQMEIADARAEAITEFSEKLKEAVKYIPWCDYPPVIRCIEEIAEKLKGEVE